jgi:hypothetical protein
VIGPGALNVFGNIVENEVKVMKKQNFGLLDSLTGENDSAQIHRLKFHKK